MLTGRGNRALSTFAACTFLLGHVPGASGAPAKSPPPTTPSPPTKAKTLAERLAPDARVHFDAALQLFEDKKYDGALVEFQAAYDLSKEPRVLRNIAVCDKFLGRYAVAIALLQQELADAKDLEPDLRTKIEDEIATLTPLTVVVSVMVNEPDAEIFVDDRPLGKGAIAEARVDVGERTFRATKAGFPDATQKLSIVSGAKPKVVLELKKAPLTSSAVATLSVVDKSGASVDVVLDGAVVGKTPWKGIVVPGTHTIGLQGPNDTGTAKQAVTVEAGKTTELTLETVHLPIALTIDTVPPGAAISIDGKPAGNAPYRGTLPKGKHLIVANAAGFVELSREVTLLSSDHPQAIELELDRWRRFSLSIMGGFFPSGGFAVQNHVPRLADGSDGGGSGNGTVLSVLAAARVGFLLTPHFGVEAFGGAFVGSRSISRVMRITSTTNPTEVLENKDHQERVGHFAPMFGVTAVLRVGESAPLTLRLSGGIAAGTTTVSEEMVDSGGQNGQMFGSRQGRLVLDETRRGWLRPFLAPELRFGVRLGRAFVMDVGVLAMIIAVPSFDLDPAAVRGYTITPDTRRAWDGFVDVLVMPTLGLHFDL